MVMMSQGAYGCAKHIRDAFFWQKKQGKIQPGVFLVSLGVSPWMSSPA